jgi:hypothetical protein
MATGSALKGREQIPKLHQRRDGNLRRANRKLCTFRIQHPHRNREGRTVRELTNYALGACPPFALANWQGLPEQRMTTIINRDGLETMGTM